MTYSTTVIAIPYMLRENSLDFFETERAKYLHTRCDQGLADINMIINENARYHVMVEQFRLSPGRDFVRHSVADGIVSYI